MITADWGVGLIEAMCVAPAPVTSPPKDLGTSNAVLIVIRNDESSN